MPAWTNETAFPLLAVPDDLDVLPIADVSLAAGSRQRRVTIAALRTSLGGGLRPIRVSAGSTTITAADNGYQVRVIAAGAVGFAGSLPQGFECVIGNNTVSDVVTLDDAGVTLLSAGESIANGKWAAVLVVGTNVLESVGAFVDDPAASTSPQLTLNAQVGTTYTFAAADGDGETLVTFTNGSPIEVTVPANSTTAMPLGTILEGAQLGAGLVTTVGATGVTINGVTPGDVDSTGQYAAWRLVKLATDTWLMSGDVV